MKRNILVEELACFCFVYGIFDQSIEEHVIKSKIESGLEKVEFIESLINTLILQTNNCKHIDIEKLKELLLELERIRLELEYKDYIKGYTNFNGNS